MPRPEFMSASRPLRFREEYQRFVSRPRDSRTDWLNPLLLLALAVIGVFFIYSAHAGQETGLWRRQVIWILVGATVYTLVSLTDYKHVFQNAHFIYLLSLILLLWVLAFGETRFNSRRWIDLGVFSFQPSEAAKIGTLVMVASMLSRTRLGSIRESVMVLLKVFIITIIPIVLIFYQPDLGSTLIFPPMVFSLLFISRLSERFFIAVFAVFVGALGILGVDIFRYHQFLASENLSAHEAHGRYEATSWLPIRDYQRTRILTFIAPETVDPRGIGASWNVRQSLQAVGTGGLWGKGWAQGTQAQLGYLPRSVAHNDFIFSVLAEEKGFMGGLAVIGVFALLIGNSLRQAGLSRDRFGTLLCLGVSAILLVHVFVNIGMTIGLMPITGLPLPFLSYGGSFMLSCCIMLGLVQSVHRHRRAFT